MGEFLWELYQNKQTRGAEASARAAASATVRAEQEVERLRDRIDMLTLTNLAMWTILRDKLGVTDQELERKVCELDMLDGVQDGKLTAGPWTCAACKRPNTPRRLACMYCGQERAKSSPFPLA